mgnify:CR=1 FL=1
MWVLVAFIFGTLGLFTWYMRMFCDNPTAELWRRVGIGFRLRRILGTGRAAQNFSAVSFPAISAAFLLMALAKCAEALGAPTWLIVSLAGVCMLLMIAALVAIIPFKYPDYFYEDWQYAKRHGLLDEGETGKKSSQAGDSGGEESFVDTQVTMRVASGWRQLSTEERSELGDLGQDESIRFIAVGEATEGYVPNIVITEAEVFSGKGDKEILDDSAHRLAEPHPGCRLIDDTVVPYPAARTRLVTGVYAHNDISMTVSQLVWLTRHRNDGDEEPRRFLWAATCTCPSLACPSIIEDFMTMARTVEVES